MYQEGRVSLGKTSWWFPYFVGGIVALISTGLYVIAFPPFDVAEAAYGFALPFLVWCFFRPGWRVYALSAFFASWVSWFLILIWLRHIHPPWGWLATSLLSTVMAVFPTVWLLGARWGLPRVAQGHAWRRMLLMLGLAGLWVVLEWVRSWLFTGFSWLPLSASQWQRPTILQVAAWTGHYGVSFVLILFNLGLVFYGCSWIRRVRQDTDFGATSTVNASESPGFGLQGQAPKRLLGRFSIVFCPEFYLAFGLLMFCLALSLFGFQERIEREPMFRLAAVQPWVPATLKWAPGEARNNLDQLKQQTEMAALLKPDVILWPEAASPFPLLDNRGDDLLRWTEHLVNTVETPLLCGNLAVFDGNLFNGVFWVRPHTGLFEVFYLKRHLVPFGEYTPLRQYLPFVDKVIPFENDIVAGQEAVVIPTVFRGEPWPVGFLICNEDIYPQLARGMALQGASWILVVTNDAWYGTEAGAYQHAANSVLRAVETRLPVVRCGNHGWSGWIDEFGSIHSVLTNDAGSIYFQGVGAMDLVRSKAFANKQSFYVQYGDWFVALCGVLAAIAFFKINNGYSLATISARVEDPLTG